MTNGEALVLIGMGAAVGWVWRSVLYHFRRCREIDRRSDAANRAFWRGKDTRWPCGPKT